MAPGISFECKQGIGNGASNLEAGSGTSYEITLGLETNERTSLHRGLKARHITMIAIGGAIGTGLIIGTGQALARSGPGSLLIAYTLIGMVVYLVMCAVGEMSSWLPISSGFTGYATRFCDPSLGFALGWWCVWVAPYYFNVWIPC